MSLQLEEFQARGAVGAGLHLVEKDECVVSHKLCLRIDETDLLQDVVGFESRAKNGFVLRLGHEVDFDEVAVCFGEVFYRKGLSHLPRSFDDKWQPLRVLFPL